MFSNFRRNFVISMNHKKRVRSIVLRSNEEIIRALDTIKDEYLEAERKEIKEDIIRFKAMKDILEWLTNETK